MAKVYISLGTNLGDRMYNLREAMKHLGAILSDLQESIVLEVEAMLSEDMPDSWRLPYLNMIACGHTDLSPLQLVDALQSIEKTMGRPLNNEKWSPRVIDLDILLYDNKEFKSDSLCIPHRELQNRKFFQHLLALMGQKDFAIQQNIDCFTKSFVLSPALVGIVNVTADSFSDGGQFDKPEKAIEQAVQLWQDGASVIDIGAQSTRPGATIKGAEQEMRSLDPVLQGLQGMKISIDTFHDEVVAWVLKKHEISWINDVQGSLCNDTLRLIRDSNVKLCIMHSLGVPPKQNITISPLDDPIETILVWANNRVEKLLSLGFDLNNVILDPGIGFGKTTYQNIEIIKRLDELKKLQVKILLGHSRKSYISAFSKLSPQQRDLETIAVSAAVAKNVDFLRVHNISCHMRALTSYGVTKK